MSTINSFIIFMKFAMVLFIMVVVLKKYLLDIFELCFPQCLKQHVFFPVDQCFSIRSTVQDIFELTFHFSCFDHRSFFIFMNH